MQRRNRAYSEIMNEEMIELVNLAMKYSPSQLASMALAVDLDNLQYDMGVNGATEEELRTSSECHHDIHEIMRMLRSEN